MPTANRILLWLLGILLLAVVTGYGLWFMENFERDTEEVKTGISPEARKNRFLAAEYYLREIGQTVQSSAQQDIFSLTPSTEDTIFLGSYSDTFFERNNEQLIEWIKKGGMLVFALDNPLSDDDKEILLLEELGVELHYAERSDETSTTNLSEPDDDPRVSVTFRTDHPGEFTAGFLADRYLHDTKQRPNAFIGDGEQAKLLRYSLGSGAVVVLSDNRLFSNDEIGKYDNAYLFSELVHTPATVWILYSTEMPSLLTLLWRHTPYLLVTTIVLLLMAIWHLLLRSGPRLSLEEDARRNLLEHLDATAEYSWRIDKAKRLLSDNRHAIEQSWRRRHPQLNSLEQEQRCEWIGEKAGIAASAVERTLYGDIKNEEDFIRATAVMQQLATRVNQHSAPAVGTQDT
ncbi:MAG: DUF4350 domain-containing protein [Pseudomonadota bacterium]